MPENGYRAPDGFLTLLDAMGRLGMSRPTIQRRVAAGELRTYTDPRNKRVRLVKVEDVERLTQPQPSERTSKRAA